MPDPTLMVVKFGGSCLETPENVRVAAEKIIAEQKKGRKIVVVVSALKGVTDQLLQTALAASGGRISKRQLDEILSMGERTSQRIFTGILHSMGVKAEGLDPANPNLWPIYTNSEHGNAEVDLEQTCKAVREKVLPLLEKGFIVVVPGFIGLSRGGAITTLGRGGSDITAVVLGRCLDAGEVVFVKDVGGVLSADPKLVSSPSRVEALDVEEMFSLSSAGAKVLHPKSLKYKTSSMTLRVVGMDEPDLSGGTII
ncbi:MAG: aspartate kinase, partial [Candidatus Hecatellales archaeon]